MKILFIGDIFAKGGRRTVKEVLPGLIEDYSPDLVLANCENLTHGNGFLPGHIEEMRQCGVDFFTSGNHVWGCQGGVEKLDDPDFPVVRPANFPGDAPGRGYAIVESKAGKVLVVNMMGQVFMNSHLDSPFKIMDKILEEVKDEDFVASFVDFHAETTSEKYALGFYLDGRVSCMVGTHTHVATKDARVLEGGTAYISDVGFTGPFDSVIGIQKDIVIYKFINQMPAKHEPEEGGQMVFNSILVEVDPGTQKALNMTHIQKFI